jgi:hypothetical protein
VGLDKDFIARRHECSGTCGMNFLGSRQVRLGTGFTIQHLWYV